MTLLDEIRRVSEATESMPDPIIRIVMGTHALAVFTEKIEVGPERAPGLIAYGLEGVPVHHLPDMDPNTWQVFRKRKDGLAYPAESGKVSE